MFDDYLVLGGDLNTNTRTEGAINVLEQMLVTSGPFPVDQSGNGNTNLTRTKPYDWILVNAGLSSLEVPEQIGANSFPEGLVFDSRIYEPLSDVPPVLVGDSEAEGMQHMAVIRRFLIQ